MVMNSPGREDPKWHNTYKKYVKHYDHRKNRRATKQAIDREDFDRIPQNHKVKEEDSWNWD